MLLFVGYERRQDLAFEVLCYSLKKHNPDLAINIIPLVYEDISPQKPRESGQSTDFSYLRYYIPYLCGYKGMAVYMDCDILCLGDIGPLNELSRDVAVHCVPISMRPVPHKKLHDKEQFFYPRKNWSSVMVLNNPLLTCWTPEYLYSTPGIELHQMPLVKTFGFLPRQYNSLDINDPGTVLLHYTSGGPWIGGCENHPEANLWLRYFEDMANKKA